MSGHMKMEGGAAVWITVLILVGLGGGVGVDTVFAESPAWQKLDEGLLVSLWKPRDTCPDVEALLLVDLDPGQYRFTVHHFSGEGLSAPLTLDQWHRRTGHAVLVNAGLFREHFAYLGLLYTKGRSIGSRQHPIWHGLFAAEPANEAERRKATILDLRTDRFSDHPARYQEAAQSLMLIDRSGTIRVRQTGKLAHQTVVAETDHGHILLIKTLSLVSLYGLAQCLQEGVPHIEAAMAMDGGSSSDLLVEPSLMIGIGPTTQGQTWKDLFTGSATGHIPLPAVIGVSRRSTEAASSGRGK